MIRASLLATAATATLNGRRVGKPSIPRLAPSADPRRSARSGAQSLPVRPRLIRTRARAPVDPLAPQVAVAAFADAETTLLASGAVLAKDQAQPGRQMTPRAEHPRLGHGRGEGGGDHRADAGHRGQRAAGRVGARHRDQPSVETGDLVRELPNLGHQQLQHLPCRGWHAVIFDRGDCGHQLPHAGLTLRRDDPELGQVATQRPTSKSWDRRRALADQLVAHPVQHQGRLPALALDRNEAHARPRHPRLAPSADHRRSARSGARSRPRRRRRRACWS